MKKVMILNFWLQSGKNNSLAEFSRSFSKKTFFTEHLLKAVAQRCSVKKVLLEISQNSQETPVPDSLFK